MEKIKYTFKNPELLELALTQSGANPESNNERLEFIGDRVLGLTVADMLYKIFPNEDEGDLARRHAYLVSTETLADVAQEINLEPHLRHGHVTAGRIRHILANAMEAIFGAIFIDGGFNAAYDVIYDMWLDRARRDAVAPKDPKTRLQELSQRQGHAALPKYTYVMVQGASHNPVFRATVTAIGITASATGASKKEASANAAAELLKILAKTESDN